MALSPWGLSVQCSAVQWISSGLSSLLNSPRPASSFRCSLRFQLCFFHGSAIGSSLKETKLEGKHNRRIHFWNFYAVLSESSGTARPILLCLLYTEDIWVCVGSEFQIFTYRGAKQCTEWPLWSQDHLTFGQ